MEKGVIVGVLIRISLESKGSLKTNFKTNQKSLNPYFAGK